MAFTGPIYMKDAYLQLKTTSGTFAVYNCQVKRAVLMPEPGETVEYKTLCASGTWSEVGRATWTLELEGPQGWSDTEGLSALFFDEQGNLLDFRLDKYGEGHVPSAEEPAFYGQVRAIPVAYGGTVDEYAEFEVALPVQGDPVKQVAAWTP
jgi:hypothetical protein